MDTLAIARSVRENRAAADQLFDGMRACSFDGIGITRASYSEEESRVHALMAAHARRLGLEVTTDPAANTCMTLPGRDRVAPRIVIGSHLDSVKQGGNFDGAAGVVAGLLAVEALQRAGITPPCDISVLGIRAEESAWFNVSYIGSRAALGVLAGDDQKARELLRNANSLVVKADSLVGNADKRVFGEKGLASDTQAAVQQLNALLVDARASLKKLDAVLVEAQAVGANTRAATEDLGALRAEVDANVRKIEQMINELNRKWPFKRNEPEIRLP